MNCQVVKRLVEDALDKRLSGAVKRQLDHHLAQCRDCRSFYEAEQAEHARWLSAMNDTVAEPPHPLPPDFADRLVAAVAANEAKVKASFFRRLRLPKWLKRVACLAVLLCGVAFATTVVMNAMTAKESAREETEATEALEEILPGTEAAADAAEASSVASNETNNQQLTTNDLTKGESEMKKGKAAAAALALVALGAVSEVQSTTPLRAASSLYKSGCEPTEPAPASSVTSASGASAPLDSRAAQSATSDAVAFNSDGVSGMMMIFR